MHRRGSFTRLFAGQNGRVACPLSASNAYETKRGEYKVPTVSSHFTQRKPDIFVKNNIEK